MREDRVDEGEGGGVVERCEVGEVFYGRNGGGGEGLGGREGAPVDDAVEGMGYCKGGEARVGREVGKKVGEAGGVVFDVVEFSGRDIVG